MRVRSGKYGSAARVWGEEVWSGVRVRTGDYGSYGDAVHCCNYGSFMVRMRPCKYGSCMMSIWKYGNCDAHLEIR